MKKKVWKAVIVVKVYSRRSRRGHVALNEYYGEKIAKKKNKFASDVAFESVSTNN